MGPTSHIYMMMIYLIFLTTAIQHSVALTLSSSIGCFPLQIGKCDYIDFQVGCQYLPEKTPETLQLSLYCQNGGNIKVLNATYSMPSLSSLICSTVDKSLHCSNAKPCYCCSDTGQICSMYTNTDEISKICNNKSSCLITVPRMQFKKMDCPTFLWGDSNCDNNPQQCLSRWIEVQYECHKQQSEETMITTEDYQQEADSITDMIIASCVVGLLITVIVLLAIIVVQLRKNKKSAEDQGIRSTYKNIPKSDP